MVVDFIYLNVVKGTKYDAQLRLTNNKIHITTIKIQNSFSFAFMRNKNTCLKKYICICENIYMWLCVCVYGVSSVISIQNIRITFRTASKNKFMMYFHLCLFKLHINCTLINS